MRFVQLYTSPCFRNQRSKLVTPSQDWEQSKGDVSKHRFSPLVGGGDVFFVFPFIFESISSSFYFISSSEGKEGRGGGGLKRDRRGVELVVVVVAVVGLVYFVL